jgi:ribosomal protein L11 methyltransferase
VVGTDLDAVSVQVAAENARQNQVPQICFLTAAGFHHSALHGQQFDLILANILARPLMKLSAAMRQHQAAGGHAILSGLLQSQSLQVLQAYRAQGYQTKQHFLQQDWTALWLHKAGA